MEEIKITKMQFGSYIKLVALNWLSMGFILGILMFVLSLFGQEVNTNLGPFILHGVAGGISAIVVGPIVFLIFGLIIGLCGYVPFNLMLRVIKGILIRFKGM